MRAQNIDPELEYEIARAKAEHAADRERHGLEPGEKK